jgi:hypothetical protein
MSNLNKFGITEAQMLALANKCELPYQFGSNWTAKFLSYNQELLALAAPSVASGAPTIRILPDDFWELVADCGGTKDLGKNARLLNEWVRAYGQACAAAEREQIAQMAENTNSHGMHIAEMIRARK